jgi:hypothetical protein
MRRLWPERYEDDPVARFEEAKAELAELLPPEPSPSNVIRFPKSEAAVCRRIALEIASWKPLGPKK